MARTLLIEPKAGFVWLVDSRRVAHILDPPTGRPIAHRLASVTVIDELAVRADALDTALMVLGGDEGFALAKQLNVAALFSNASTAASPSARRPASRRSRRGSDANGRLLAASGRIDV